MGTIRLLAGALVLTGLAASAQTFVPVNNLPTPAPGAFTIVGDTLPDGRFVIWNGDGVYVQSTPGSGIFGLAATGYAGDPAFVDVAPDGHTLLLGAGFGNGVTANGYLVDVFAPVNYTAGTELEIPSHASGVFLSQDLVLLDRGTSDFNGSELVMVDLAAAKSGDTTARTVVTSPPSEAKDLVVDKPPFSYSVDLFVDFAGADVYAMDGNAKELRIFAVADLINAFNTSMPLDWSTDGTLFGATGIYYDGGVAGFNSSNELIIDGSSGFLQPGGIQFIDRTTGVINQTLTPGGVNEYYYVIFNSVTEDMIARISSSSTTYATFGAVQPLPAASIGALLSLAGLMVAAGVFMQRRAS